MWLVEIAHGVSNFVPSLKYYWDEQMKACEANDRVPRSENMKNPHFLDASKENRT
jgi:hypothetical protein